MTRIDQIYRALGPSGVRIAHGTRPGVKATGNEDAVIISFPPEDHPHSGVLCSVADGVGGLSQGAAASNAAVQVLASSYHAGFKGNGPASLREAVLAAHHAVRQATGAKNGRHAGATTLVAVVVQSNDLLVANVGDSRAYLFSPDGTISQITVDHSWVQQQMQAGVLTQEQAAVHPWRKMITSSLGGPDMPEVDIFHRSLHIGEQILLCSDGLVEVARDEEIANILSANDPESSVSRLLELAHEKGARDDVTVCIIQPDLTDIPTEKVTWDYTAEPRSLGHSSFAARALRFLAKALLAMLVLSAVGIGIAWKATEDTITPGVVASTGVSLSGIKASEAAYKIEANMARPLSCPMTIEVERRNWTRTSSELGLWIDGNATAAAANRIGHAGTVQEQALERINTALYGRVVDPVVRVNTQKLLWQLIVIADEFDRTSDGSLQVDLPRAMFVVNQQLLEQPCSKVTLPTRVASESEAG